MIEPSERKYFLAFKRAGLIPNAARATSYTIFYDPHPIPPRMQLWHTNIRKGGSPFLLERYIGELPYSRQRS
jgi:hypothetical protein